MDVPGAVRPVRNWSQFPRACDGTDIRDYLYGPDSHNRILRKFECSLGKEDIAGRPGGLHPSAIAVVKVEGFSLTDCVIGCFTEGTGMGLGSK